MSASHKNIENDIDFEDEFFMEDVESLEEYDNVQITENTSFIKYLRSECYCIFCWICRTKKRCKK